MKTTSSNNTPHEQLLVATAATFAVLVLVNYINWAA